MRVERSFVSFYRKVKRETAADAIEVDARLESGREGSFFPEPPDDVIGRYVEKARKEGIVVFLAWAFEPVTFRGDLSLDTATRWTLKRSENGIWSISHEDTNIENEQPKMKESKDPIERALDLIENA